VKMMFERGPISAQFCPLAAIEWRTGDLEGPRRGDGIFRIIPPGITVILRKGIGISKTGPGQHTNLLQPRPTPHHAYTYTHMYTQLHVHWKARDP